MTKSLSTKGKISIIYLSWCLVWILDQALVLHQTGFSWKISFLDAIITQLVIALAGYVINTTMHSYQPSAKNSVYVLAWSMALGGLCVLLQRWLLMQVIGNDVEYAVFLESTLTVRGGFAWLMIMLVAVLSWFWVYLNEKQETEKRQRDSERLVREAELSSLRLQLQPHFLFNSLNSISALVSVEPERARTMIHQLSDFLRGTLRKETTLVTLEEELKHLALYLEIEKVRFGHRLQTSIDSSDESMQMKLPLLLLQPVVENAIKFGLYDTIGEITIFIQTQTDASNLIVTVKNPYDPATAQPRKGTGFGLSSIQRRLYLLYAQNELVQTRQEETTFITTLKIPQLV